MLLKADDLLFDAQRRDVAAGDHARGASEPMGAIDGLLFDSVVPPRIAEKNVIGCGQVESDAARLQADEEELRGGIILKLADDSLPVCGLSISIHMPPPSICNLPANKVE